MKVKAEEENVSLEANVGIKIKIEAEVLNPSTKIILHTSDQDYKYYNNGCRNNIDSVIYTPFDEDTFMDLFESTIGSTCEILSENRILQTPVRTSELQSTMVSLFRNLEISCATS